MRHQNVDQYIHYGSSIRRKRERGRELIWRNNSRKLSKFEKILGYTNGYTNTQSSKNSKYDKQQIYRDIIIKVSKAKDKDRILKAVREMHMTT